MRPYASQEASVAKVPGTQHRAQSPPGSIPRLTSAAARDLQLLREQFWGLCGGRMDLTA